MYKRTESKGLAYDSPEKLVLYHITGITHYKKFNWFELVGMLPCIVMPREMYQS